MKQLTLQSAQGLYKNLMMILIVILLYGAGMYFSMNLVVANHSFSIFFIPAGIAIGLSLIYGYKVALPVAMTKVLYALIINSPGSDSSFLGVSLTAFSSAIETCIGLYIYRAFINRNNGGFSYNVTLLIAVFSPIVSALIGVWNKSHVSQFVIESYFQNFYTYYSGDVLGILVVLPLFINFLEQKEIKLFDFISPFIALFISYVFNFEFSSPYSVLILMAIFIPAFFGTNFGLSFTVIIVSTFLNWTAFYQLSNFSDLFIQNSFLRVQIFILAIALFALAISELKKSRLFKIGYKPLLILWFFISLIFYYNYRSNRANSDLYIDQKVRSVKILLNEKINNLKIVTIGNEALINSSQKVTKEEWLNYQDSIKRNSELGIIKIQGLAQYDSKGDDDNFVVSYDKNISDEKIHKLLEMNFFEQYYYKSVNYSEIVMSPLYEIYGEDGKKYDIVFMIKANKIGDQLKSLSIVGFDIDQLFTSIIDQHFNQLDIDIYEVNNSSNDKLVFSQRAMSSNQNLQDNPNSVITHFKILNAVYKIHWNDTFRIVLNHENVNPIIILIGSLITFVFSSFLMSKKLYALKNDKNTKALKNKVSEAQHKFQLLFDSTDDAVVIFNLDEIISANRSALEILGISSLEEAYHFNPAEIISLRKEESLGDQSFFKSKILEVNLKHSVSFTGFCLTKHKPVYAKIHIGQIHMKNQYLYMMILAPIVEHHSTNVTTRIINVSDNQNKQPVLQVSNAKSPLPNEARPHDEDGDSIFHNQEILLVEDNEVNIMMSKKYLEKWGLRVDVAENGKIAVAKALSKNYALILMDIHMPVMDGYEATRIIRQTNKTVPIVALSADVLNNLSEENYFVKFTDFIPKPFRVDDFLSKMKQYIK